MEGMRKHDVLALARMEAEVAELTAALKRSVIAQGEAESAREVAEDAREKAEETARQWENVARERHAKIEELEKIVEARENAAWDTAQ